MRKRLEKYASSGEGFGEYLWIVRRTVLGNWSYQLYGPDGMMFPDEVTHGAWQAAQQSTQALLLMVVQRATDQKQQAEEMARRLMLTSESTAAKMAEMQTKLDEYARREAERRNRDKEQSRDGR